MSAPRKIPATALPEIRSRRDAGESLRSIGESYGVAVSTVHSALTRPVSPQAARLCALEAVARAARSLERCADHSCEVPWCVRCQRESASQEALAAAFRDLDGGS